MRRAVLITAAGSALVVALLALKPHQPPALAGVTPRPAETASPHATTGAGPGAGGSRTGTFTGDPVDTQYGTVQVSATLARGRITAIRVLRAPDSNGRDQQIAAYALPRLTREALGAQSAHIDAVSGASYTSQGYVRSLQSALDRSGG
ncbi:FMN-binding protein [Streptomyces sp. NBC_01267]|uniref:FMN-binding protein n=1 Tax=unclassified Streptomyces TaxID=2593676 RepID=UPI002024C666|nr:MULTISPECIES: FMN-binding protein [unclassified Streptomyces]MCX4553993.1 FMN-binding protein [Streptomyces sp. NBC_01500]WSC18898.1 FMN-binding protein [Streptomyces sp. NBC_01766]WSV52933.1 FMN-binding protein [Streptomyces sp. NBC_01014]